MRTTPRRLTLQTIEERLVPASILADSAFQFGTAFTSGQYAGEKGLATDAVGNTYALGYKLSSSNPFSQPTEPFVAKYDPAGRLVWQQPTGTAGIPTTVTTDQAGNVYVGGVTAISFGFVEPNTPTVDPDVYLEKFTSAGVSQWRKVFANPGYDSVDALAADTLGNVFIGGTQADATALGMGNTWLAKLTATGTTAWSQSPEGLGGITALVADGQGGVYYGGNGTAPEGGVGFIGTVSATGQRMTPFVFRGTSTFASVTVAGLERAPTGELYVVGSIGGSVDFDPTSGTLVKTAVNSGDFIGFNDLYVACLAPTGTPRWVHTFGSDYYDRFSSFDRAADGTLYMVGTVEGVADFDPSANVVAPSVTTMYSSFILAWHGDGTFQQVETGPIGGEGLVPQTLVVDGLGQRHIAGTYMGAPDVDPTAGTTYLPIVDWIGSYLALVGNVPTPPPPVGNQAPVVTPPTPFTSNEGQALTLTLQATDAENDYLTVAWDLDGDGAFDDAIRPAATIAWNRLQALGIADSGTYPLAVRVTDGRHEPVIYTTTFTVVGVAPTALLSNVTTVEGGTAKVRHTQAKDPSPADTQAGFRYSYDFDGDGRWDMGNGSTYAGSVADGVVDVPTAFLRESGVKTLRTRLFDKDGAYTDYAVLLTVRNVAPQATFVADGPVGEGLTAVVRFRNVIDPSAQDTRAGFRYSYDFNNDGVWDFGDGRTYGGSVVANSGRVPATYLADNGTYPVRGRVFDRDGTFTEYTTPITVLNLAPTARLNVVGSATVNQPTTLAFSWQFDESAADRAAGYTYQFDFDNAGLYEVTTRTAKYTYTFKNLGANIVRGRITDKDGGSTSVLLTVNVLGTIVA